jgi:hypothetical protein
MSREEKLLNVIASHLVGGRRIKRIFVSPIDLDQLALETLGERPGAARPMLCIFGPHGKVTVCSTWWLAKGEHAVEFHP